MGQKPFVRNPGRLQKQCLTERKSLHYLRIRMTHLDVIAACPTASFWWRGFTLAARWRD